MLVYWVGAAFPSLSVTAALGTAGMAIANLCMATLLGARWIEAGYFPLSNLYESLFFLTWGITAVHLIAENSSRSRLVGVVTAPVAMCIAAFATLTLPSNMQVSEPLVPALKSNWLMMHVSMMMFSYAILLLGSLLSIVLLFLKQDSSSFNSNRNNLIIGIDNWSYRTIGLGFPCLTIGIISGAVWANEAWGSYWSWDPKETWALITWLVFAIYLHSRLIKGWQGKQAALVGSCGFFVIWICYLGVNFLGKGLHSYGWVL
jgi:cytochrome c-type biogenesis protein CcsB